jgi:hypothetical protein
MAGVIAEATRMTDDGSTWRFRLADGQTVTIDFNVADVILATGAGDPGNLLLYGAVDEQPWYATLRPLQEHRGCFLIQDDARDEGQRIQFDQGLRLPKSDGFIAGENDEGRIRGGGVSGLEDFCINDRGEVRAYGTAIFALEADR